MVPGGWFTSSVRRVSLSGDTFRTEQGPLSCPGGQGAHFGLCLLVLDHLTRVERRAPLRDGLPKDRTQLELPGTRGRWSQLRSLRV